MLDWHYSRTALARAYLQRFTTGMSSALTLFAPEGYGKSEFLLRDLAPCAEAQGERVVYVSMRLARNEPLAALLAALAEAREPQGVCETVKAMLASPLKPLDWEAAMGAWAAVRARPGRGEVKRTEAPGDLLRIRSDLDRLTRKAGSGRAVLLLDEVQYLARPQSEDLVAALRTALDVMKQSVKVVYTGSSRAGLQRLFERIQAPLYRSSQIADFPELDEGFVKFILASARRATHRALDLKAAWEGFQVVAKSPRLFRRAIEAVILYRCDDIVGVCRKLAGHAEHGARYEDTWRSYPHIDRAILRRVVLKQPLFAASARQGLAARIGAARLSPQRIQARVARLVEAEVLLKPGRGQYEVEDSGFADWIRKQR